RVHHLGEIATTHERGHRAKLCLGNIVERLIVENCEPTTFQLNDATISHSRHDSTDVDLRESESVGNDLLTKGKRKGCTVGKPALRQPLMYVEHKTRNALLGVATPQIDKPLL